MKKQLIIFIIFLLSTVMHGQIDESIIDKIKQYPIAYKQVQPLADRILIDFASDLDRAAAIYSWMALNIKYDVKAFYSNRNKNIGFTYSSLEEKEQKEKELRNKIALKTLSKSKAVCQGYSELYRLLCELCDINCEVISGFSKTMPTDIGKSLSVGDHAWNAIHINDQWHLLDVTWAAGYVDHQKKKFVPNFNSAYFLTPSDLFFLNHFPEREEWILCNKSKDDFINLPVFYSNYLSANYRIVKPTSGVITKAKKGQIIIEISPKTTAESFNYKLSNERYMQEVEVSVNNDRLILTIPVDHHKRGYLDIITDNQSIATYKLRIK